MKRYLARRLLLMIPTLIGISLATFVLINLVPGGLIDQKLHGSVQGPAHITATPGLAAGGVSPEVLEAMKRQYGLDRPLHERYLLWLSRLVRFDFGKSFDYNRPVMDVIISRFPVSLQFGVLSFFLTYLVSVGAGLLMARREGLWQDQALGFSLLTTSAIPPFAVAILLLVFLAGGSFLNIFPIGFIQSENYAELSVFGRVVDRTHHFVLPLLAYVSGSFTALAYLTRNSILGEMRKDYVRTARAYGASESSLFYKHAFRNALVPISTGIGSFVGVFLGGSLLIENIFQLNGIGRLGYQSLLVRDYNMIMALTILQSLTVLLGNLLGDVVYRLVDPRITYD